MKKMFLYLALGLAIILPISVKAAYFQSSNSGIQTIKEGQNLRNAYLAGSTINVDGDIQKDLFIAGSTLNINGKVEDDLVAAGNTIFLKGPVGGSARVAGSTISIDSSIGEDLLMAGGDITLSGKTKISHDLILAANRAEIGGEVDGNVKLVGSNITISGIIKGDLSAKDVTNLKITKDAQILGKLTYSSPNQAVIEDGAKVVGVVDYSKTTTKDWTGWKNRAQKMSLGFTLYQMLGTIILLFLLVYLAPKMVKRYVDESFDSAFKNLWVGLLALIIIPIVSVIFIAISFQITLVLMLVYTLSLIIASSFAVLLIGSWTLKALKNSSEYNTKWESIVMGALVAILLSFVPFVGSTLLFVVMLIAFGSILTSSHNSLK